MVGLGFPTHQLTVLVLFLLFHNNVQAARFLSHKSDASISSGTCTKYTRQGSNTYTAINTTHNIPCSRCQWDALTNLSSFEVVRFNSGPVHTYFTLPYMQCNDGGSPTGLCVLLGAWGGPVATIEAPCHDCLQACQLHSECVSLVHNGVDIAREGTSCVSATPGAPPTVRAQPRALTTNSDFFTNQEDQEDDNPFLWAAQQLPLPPRSPIGAPPPGRGPLAMPSVTPAPSRSPAHDSSSRLTTSAVISALYYGRTGVYGAPVGRMQPYAQGGGYVRGAPVPMPVYGAPVYASPAAGGYAAPYRGAMPPMVGGAPASYQSQTPLFQGFGRRRSLLAVAANDCTHEPGHPAMRMCH